MISSHGLIKLIEKRDFEVNLQIKNTLASVVGCDYDEQEETILIFNTQAIKVYKYQQQKHRFVQLKYKYQIPNLTKLHYQPYFNLMIMAMQNDLYFIEYESFDVILTAKFGNDITALFCLPFVKCILLFTNMPELIIIEFNDDLTINVHKVIELPSVVQQIAMVDLHSYLAVCPDGKIQWINLADHIKHFAKADSKKGQVNYNQLRTTESQFFVDEKLPRYHFKNQNLTRVYNDSPNMFLTSEIINE